MPDSSATSQSMIQNGVTVLETTHPGQGGNDLEMAMICEDNENSTAPIISEQSESFTAPAAALSLEEGTIAASPGKLALEDDSQQDDSSLPSSCCWHQHARVKQLYQTADWWSLWIGLVSFGLAVALVFSDGLAEIQDNPVYIIPQPAKWRTQHPSDAWDVYNLVGIPILLSVLACLYYMSLYAMGKLETKEDDNDDNNNLTVQYMMGFGFMSVLATIAFWLGRNEWTSQHGLGYAVWSIVLGMLVTNATPLLAWYPWLLRAAKDGEFFIKCSLVLLAVELNLLISVGGPAMLVAWIGSPIAIAAGFYLGMTLFDCKDSLAMLIAVGASWWCGASAISAVAPIVAARSEDVSLAISVVAFFTIILTFVQPYLAMAVGLSDDVAGAWIGGSVDQTGNVVVSAAIISDQATQVASIVKMVLNAGLGVMASIISCYWNSRRNPGEEQKPFNLIMLWDKFPKFTIGFIITSAILTLLMQNLDEGTTEAEALPAAVSSLNRWWFAIAFVGIGLTTNIKKLWEKAWKSGIIQVYLLANTIDILLALGLSYLVYS